MNQWEKSTNQAPEAFIPSLWLHGSVSCRNQTATFSWTRCQETTRCLLDFQRLFTRIQLLLWWLRALKHRDWSWGFNYHNSGSECCSFTMLSLYIPPYLNCVTIEPHNSDEDKDEDEFLHHLRNELTRSGDVQLVHPIRGRHSAAGGGLTGMSVSHKPGKMSYWANWCHLLVLLSNYSHI